MHPLDCRCAICLVDRSSFGTPEAKALRNSVSNEQVQRVMNRVRELDGDLFAKAAERARQMAANFRAIAPSLEQIYDGDDCGSRFDAALHDATAALLESEAAHQFGPTAEAIDLARLYMGGAA